MIILFYFSYTTLFHVKILSNMYLQKCNFFFDIVRKMVKTVAGTIYMDILTLAARCYIRTHEIWNPLSRGIQCICCSICIVKLYQNLTTIIVFVVPSQITIQLPIAHHRLMYTRPPMTFEFIFSTFKIHYDTEQTKINLCLQDNYSYIYYTISTTWSSINQNSF